MVDAPVATIRRQIVDVDVHGSEADGIALHRRMSDVCTGVLLPALEAAFAALDIGDRHVLVDRLDLDLASVSLRGLEAELPSALRREVESFFRYNPPDTNGVFVPASGDEREGVGARERSAVTHRSAAEAADEALIVFLGSGRLPWSFDLAGAGLEEALLAAWSHAGATPEQSLARHRVSAVLDDARARTRLVLQFTTRFTTTFLARFFPDLATPVAAALDAVAGARAPARVAFTVALWGEAMGAATESAPPTTLELVSRSWRGMAASDQADDGLRTAIAARWPDLGLPEAPEDTRSLGPQLSRPERNTVDEVAADLDEEDGGVLVDNAGSVILHPFLPAFFETLGVAVGDELTDPDRALCLLHYLATGDTTAPEHALTLAKVLCGVAPADPVPAEVGLTAAETEEAAALLHAVIGHWEALRSTSPDGLRREFLMRPGLLLRDADGGWLLRVEHRTADILLAQLPWGVSMISLPWMAGLMRVEWQ